MSNRILTATVEEGGHLATAEEVASAIENLSAFQKVRLQKFAKIKVSRSGIKANAPTWDELLSEAYLDVLEGTRKWDRSKVDFFGLLIGAMQSIAWSWRQKLVRAANFHNLGEDRKIQEIPLYELDEDGNRKMLPLISPDLNPEQQLLENEQQMQDQILLERVLRRVEERNEHSPFVLLERMEGKKGPEIQQSLGITQTQYETEMRWYRRNATQLLAQ
jgi:hypothetical protein